MEEKKERKKILLVIAIFAVIFVVTVGGVYAYFAARVTTNEGAITGQTLDINGGTLSISAQRVSLSPSPTPVSDNLVPANFGVSPSEMTTTEVNRALDSKCAGGGYTGCHVWKITARSTIDIPSANVKLNLSLTSVIDQNEWSYIVYTGTDNSSTTVLNKGNIITSFPNTNTTIDIHNGASLTANTSVYYYVMVYLNNINSAQNDGVTINTTDERGTYNGTVTLEALGGQVKVDFLDRSTPAEFFEYDIDLTSATYTVTDQSACESYMENWWECGSDTECITNAEQICENGTNDWGDTLENFIVAEDIPSSDYAAAGLFVSGREVTITGYKNAPATTYTVTNQSACESYIQNLGASAEMAITLCSGGDVDGYTLGNAIAEEAIPSSDYSAAGINVVITPAPTDVVIPSAIEGLPVTAIGYQAFWNKGLTSVVIPSSVISIGGYAFANNPLTSVEIPNSVISISSYAFYNNQLTSLVIPNSVTSIAPYAFDENPLTSITIGNQNVTMDNCAFGLNPPLSEPFLSNYPGCSAGE